MNHREALEELGLTAEAGREEIRRAYSRLLKTRKPDSDKPGFMRLREAYELLKGGAQAFANRQPMIRMTSELRGSRRHDA